MNLNAYQLLVKIADDQRALNDRLARIERAIVMGAKFGDDDESARKEALSAAARGNTAKLTAYLERPDNHYSRNTGRGTMQQVIPQEIGP